MACVETAIPIPNPRKKTDELFLTWLSEPSTQQLLRKELMKMSGVPLNDLDDSNGISKDEQNSTQNVTTPSVVTNVLRPGSPINMRTPSPPHNHLSSSRSPGKSSRGAGVVGRSSRSPKKSASKSTSGTAEGKVKSSKNGLQFGLEDVDGEMNGVHLSFPASNGGSVLDIDGHTEEREREAHGHSLKPDSFPTVSTPNHIPKLGTTIPRFYFPNGKPQPEEDLQERFSELMRLFQSFEGEIGMNQFGEITKASCCF